MLRVPNNYFLNVSPGAFFKLFLRITFFYIFPWFWCQWFTYFRILVEYTFVNGFDVILMQKRCPKTTNNYAKIDPSASQGGVWLPGSIWLAVDMPFLRCLMPKWFRKWPENILVEPPMVPRVTKMSHFPPNGRSGGVFWALRTAVHLLLC